MLIYMEILVESLVIVTVISAAACFKIPVLALSLCCRTSSEHLLLLDSLLNLLNLDSGEDTNTDCQSWTWTKVDMVIKLDKTFPNITLGKVK